jgi:16S rRNA G966 N2-methylase RsmD
VSGAGEIARSGTRLELTFLPGLGDVLADEVTEVLAPARPPRPMPGRDDALTVVHTGPLRDVLGLRTAVAAFVVLGFDVPRPKSLTSGEHLPRIVEAMVASLRVAGSSSFRFEAAGSDSAVFARLAALLADATGLAYRPDDGELVVRVRRGPRRDDGADPGWQVLVRVGPRPLSARRWRVADFPGAVNATIAAAMARLSLPRPDDRVLNLMCGSGTLLVERLAAGPAATAVGVDDDPAALAAATANLAAAGLARRVRLVAADATDPMALAAEVAADGPFDLLLADPPWGDLHGSHDDAARVHTGLLAAAAAVAAPDARLVVLTHEVRVMERVLRDAPGGWRADGPALRVYAKGHHPRIWVLHRAAP